jgi:hypothetical protein
MPFTDFFQKGSHLTEVTSPASPASPTEMQGIDHLDPIANGTAVEVRNRYVGSWSRGFEVAGNEHGRYRIRRVSDNSILPDDFDPSDVRHERRKHDFWWY